MRDSLLRRTNPKRKRGNAFRPSLTLRVSVRIGREPSIRVVAVMVVLVVLDDPPAAPLDLQVSF